MCVTMSKPPDLGSSQPSNGKNEQKEWKDPFLRYTYNVLKIRNHIYLNISHVDYIISHVSGVGNIHLNNLLIH